MQVIKEQLEETGLMKVNLNSQNWAEYVDSFVAGKLPFFMLGWFPDFADPETWLSPFASCIQSPDNGVNYCNEEMDALLTKAASSSDPAVREATYKEIGELYAEEVPTIPLFWEPEFVTTRTGVEGVKIGPPFEFNYNVVSFTADAVPAAGSPDTLISAPPMKSTAWMPTMRMLLTTGNLEEHRCASVDIRPGTADLIPGVAAELPAVSEDGKTYTFKLREGVKFC